jgi:hypothetical protein
MTVDQLNKSLESYGADITKIHVKELMLEIPHNDLALLLEAAEKEAAKAGFIAEQDHSIGNYGANFITITSMGRTIKFKPV